MNELSNKLWNFSGCSCV